MYTFRNLLVSALVIISLFWGLHAESLKKNRVGRSQRISYTKSCDKFEKIFNDLSIHKDLNKEIRLLNKRINVLRSYLKSNPYLLSEENCIDYYQIAQYTIELFNNGRGNNNSKLLSKATKFFLLFVNQNKNSEIKYKYYSALGRYLNSINENKKIDFVSDAFYSFAESLYKSYLVSSHKRKLLIQIVKDVLSLIEDNNNNYNSKYIIDLYFNFLSYIAKFHKKLSGRVIPSNFDFLYYYNITKGLSGDLCDGLESNYSTIKWCTLRNDTKFYRNIYFIGKIYKLALSLNKDLFKDSIIDYISKLDFDRKIVLVTWMGACLYLKSEPNKKQRFVKLGKYLNLILKNLNKRQQRIISNYKDFILRNKDILTGAFQRPVVNWIEQHKLFN